jgi:general secretion pathway protein M
MNLARNMARLSPRERKIVALAILLAAILILIFGLLVPYVARYSHYVTAIDDGQFRLARLQSAAAQLPPLEAEIEVLREQALSRGYLLDAGTPSLAAAQIQEQVGSMVAAHGGNILSIQVGRPVEEQGFTRVTVRVRMTSTSEELADLFSDIESRRPLLFLDNIQIRVARQRVRRGVAEQATGQVEHEFDLFAYMPGAGG